MEMEKRIPNMEMLRMQALSILHVPHPFLVLDDFSPIQEKLDPYCSVKQQIHNGIEEKVKEQEFIFSCTDSARTFIFVDDPYCSAKEQIHNNAEEKFEEQEFSFSCTDSAGTLIYADEIFEDGQIRPIFPTFNPSLLFTTTQNNDTQFLRPPLKSIFVQQTKKTNSKLSGLSNDLHNDQLQNMTLVEMKTSNDYYEKSNSTGFSKVCKFRQDLKLRSNSDHNDAFVFLNPPVVKKSNKENKENITVKKRNGGANKATLSPHEKLYVMNRMKKESNKRRSFLPYKQQLFGIFTNRNGLSRNLHPF